MLKNAGRILLAVFIIDIALVLIFTRQNPKQRSGFEDSSVEISAKPRNQWSRYREKWDGVKLVSYIGSKTLEFSEAYVRTMEEKGDHPLVTMHPDFEERRRRLDNFCQLYPSKNNYLYFKIPGRYLYNEFYQIASCLPPKTSSTQWVKIFTKLAVFKENFTNARTAVLKYRNLSLAYRLRDEEFISRVYQTYLKFYTVRHPFARLVSAFYNKLTSNTFYERKYGHLIIKSNYFEDYPTNESKLIERLSRDKASQVEQEWKLSQLKRMGRVGGNLNLTFLEFVTYITKVKNRNNLEQHWRPFVLLCNPCILKYDVILKFETIFEEANDLLHFITNGKPNRPSVSYPKNTPSVTRETCNKEFSQVSISLRNKLYKIFEEDFLFYNYTTSIYSPCG